MSLLYKTSKVKHLKKVIKSAPVIQYMFYVKNKLLRKSVTFVLNEQKQH